MISEMLLNGEIKPRKIPERPTVLEDYFRYKERTAGMLGRDKSDIWMSDGMDEVRKYIDEIYSICRENRDNFEFLRQAFINSEGEDIEILRRALNKWVEYIKEAKDFCCKAGINIPDSFFAPIKTWKGGSV